MPPSRSVLALVIAFLASGCMTLTSGRSQWVSFNSSPPGATATIRPGSIVVQTPAQLSLSRRGPYSVLFEKPGYEPAITSISRHVERGVWFNFLFLHAAAILIPIDFATGSAYRLEPTDVAVTMKPLASPPSVSSR